MEEKERIFDLRAQPPNTLPYITGESKEYLNIQTEQGIVRIYPPSLHANSNKSIVMIEKDGAMATIVWKNGKLTME